MYNYLVRTPEFLALPESNTVELQETDRRSLMQGMEKMGKLYYREKKYTDTVWSTYIVIMKGGYIYFFRNAGDTRPAFSLYVKSGKVVPGTADLGRENAFIVIAIQSSSYINILNLKFFSLKAGQIRLI